MKSFIIALCTVVVLGSCADNATTPADTNTSSTNSFNISGNGYSNAAFKGYNADSASRALETGSGAAISFSGVGSKTDEVFVVALYTDEAKAGTYTIDLAKGVSFTLFTAEGGTSKVYVAFAGEIDIKSWDAVGGRAKGTFIGSAMLNGTATIVTIADGKFDVKRL